MAPKRGRPTAAAKGKAPKQQQLEQLPLIKKPLEIIGESINVPGAFLPPPHELRPRWRGDTALRARLAEAADLASFQLSAVWAGLVDQILWVRPVHLPVDARERDAAEGRVALAAGAAEGAVAKHHVGANARAPGAKIGRRGPPGAEESGGRPQRSRSPQRD